MTARTTRIAGAMLFAFMMFYSKAKTCPTAMAYLKTVNVGWVMAGAAFGVGLIYCLSKKAI